MAWPTSSTGAGPSHIPVTGKNDAFCMVCAQEAYFHSDFSEDPVSKEMACIHCGTVSYRASTSNLVVDPTFLEGYRPAENEREQAKWAKFNGSLTEKITNYLSPNWRVLEADAPHLIRPTRDLIHRLITAELLFRKKVIAAKGLSKEANRINNPDTGRIHGIILASIKILVEDRNLVYINQRVQRQGDVYIPKFADAPDVSVCSTTTYLMAYRCPDNTMYQNRLMTEGQKAARLRYFYTRGNGVLDRRLSITDHFLLLLLQVKVRLQEITAMDRATRLKAMKAPPHSSLKRAQTIDRKKAKKHGVKPQKAYQAEGWADNDWFYFEEYMGTDEAKWDQVLPIGYALWQAAESVNLFQNRDLGAVATAICIWAVMALVGRTCGNLTDIIFEMGGYIGRDGGRISGRSAELKNMLVSWGNSLQSIGLPMPPLPYKRGGYGDGFKGYGAEKLRGIPAMEIAVAVVRPIADNWRAIAKSRLKNSYRPRPVERVDKKIYEHERDKIRPIIAAAQQPYVRQRAVKKPRKVLSSAGASDAGTAPTTPAPSTPATAATSDVPQESSAPTTPGLELDLGSSAPATPGPETSITVDPQPVQDEDPEEPIIPMRPIECLDDLDEPRALHVGMLGHERHAFIAAETAADLKLSPKGEIYVDLYDDDEDREMYGMLPDVPAPIVTDAPQVRQPPKRKEPTQSSGSSASGRLAKAPRHSNTAGTSSSVTPEPGAITPAAAVRLDPGYQDPPAALTSSPAPSTNDTDATNSESLQTAAQPPSVRSLSKIALNSTSTPASSTPLFATTPLMTGPIAPAADTPGILSSAPDSPAVPCTPQAPSPAVIMPSEPSTPPPNMPSTPPRSGSKRNPIDLDADLLQSVMTPRTAKKLKAAQMPPTGWLAAAQTARSPVRSRVAAPPRSPAAPHNPRIGTAPANSDTRLIVPATAGSMQSALVPSEVRPMKPIAKPAARPQGRKPVFDPKKLAGRDRAKFGNPAATRNLPAVDAPAVPLTPPPTAAAGDELPGPT